MDWYFDFLTTPLSLSISFTAFSQAANKIYFLLNHPHLCFSLSFCSGLLVLLNWFSNFKFFFLSFLHFFFSHFFSAASLACSLYSYALPHILKAYTLLTELVDAFSRALLCVYIFFFFFAEAGRSCLFYVSLRSRVRFAFNLSSPSVFSPSSCI